MRSLSINVFFIINVLLLVVTACQPPAPPTRPSSQETIVALIQTITAQAAGVSDTAVPTGFFSTDTPPAPIAVVTETPSVPTASPQATIEASATPYIPPTITVTASPSVPLLNLSSETNCRSGPSQYYRLVLTAGVGTKYVVIGKYTPTNYWVIILSDDRECWVWGQYATLEGNVNSLPEYSPPAVGRIEGEVRSSPAPDASKVAQAFVNIGLGFPTFETKQDGKFFFEDVPLGEVKIDVSHNHYRFPNSIRVIVNTGQLSTITIPAGVPIHLTYPPLQHLLLPGHALSYCRIAVFTHYQPSLPFRKKMT